MSAVQLIRTGLDVRPARALLEDRERSPPADKVATGSPPLDRLLAGGLRPGGTVQVYGRRSAGRFSVVLETLAAATGCCGSAALVDLGDSLDPNAAAASGVELERLLWARPRRLAEALAAAEAIVQSGIPVVVIDLGLPPLPGSVAPSSWRRLARSAQATQVALLISSPYRIAGTTAEVVIEAVQPRPRWLGTGFAPRVLSGLICRLVLRKSRELWQSVAEADNLRLTSPEAIQSGPDEAAVAVPEEATGYLRATA